MAENQKKASSLSELKRLREALHLSQAQLAERINVAEARTVRRWENGEALPYRNQRPLLAEALGISLDQLDTILDERNKDTLQRPWIMPYQRNLYFTGRETVLERLHTLLQTKSTVLLTHAITGLGGIGKTLLAVEYAYRYAKENEEYEAVFWMQANSQETLLSSFLKIAQILRLPEQEQQLLIDAVHRWLAEHSNWLLIFDNVEELQVIQPFLPPSQGKGPGHVLLTTRLQAGGTVVATKLDIEPMDLEEGSTFLLRRAKKLERQQSPDQAGNDERKIAEILCQEMDGLPLALDQAGAYIEETGCTLSHYLERHQTQRAALLKRRGALIQEDMHPQSVTVTFLLSLAKIAQANPDAADLLRFCAFLAPDIIPEDLFIRCSAVLPSKLQNLVAAPLLFEEAIALIRRYSLIQRLVTSQSMSIHRVVQAVLQDDLAERNEHKEWKIVIVSALATLLAGADPKTIQTEYEPYIPHALAGVEFVHQEHFQSHAAGHLLFLMASYLTRHAQYEHAEQCCHETIALYREYFGSEHPRMVPYLLNLAQLCKERRQYTQEQALLEQAIAILEKTETPQPSSQAMVLLNLAQCYWSQGKFFEAERIAQKTLPVLELLEGPETSNVAACLIYIAIVYRDTGRLQQAKPLYQRALQIYEHLGPPNHYGFAHCLEAYATNEMFQSNFDQAERCYRKALALFEEIVGKEHPDTAGCLCRLADLFMGRILSQEMKNPQMFLDEVERYNRRALAIYEKVGGPDYLEINQPLQGLAMIAFMRGENIQAGELYQQAISLIERSQTPFHTDLIAAYNGYVQVLLSKGQYEQARQFEQRVEALERRTLLGYRHLAF